MSNKENRCMVLTPYGKIWGTIIKEYEEMGGPDDGAKFAIIELDNGQRITVQIKVA